MTVNPIIYNIHIRHDLNGSINRLYRSNQFKKEPIKISPSKMSIWRKAEIAASVFSVGSLAVGIVRLFTKRS